MKLKFFTCFNDNFYNVNRKQLIITATVNRADTGLMTVIRMNFLGGTFKNCIDN